MFIPIEFQKALQKTEQLAIAIVAGYDENSDVFRSRFGGVPYWEKGQDLPVDDNGKLLALLAQINFAELPANSVFPRQGIVQFFVPRDDEYYGANLAEVGGKSQLVSQYWAEPIRDKALKIEDFSHENDLVPVFGAHTLCFSEKREVAGMDTIECAEALTANPFEVLEDVALNEKEETLFFEAITDHVAAHGHKLLGYPCFINGDPREHSDYRLLLQIDSDMGGDNDIMWGDDGVGQLFIRDADLQVQRFDRVWLYWDC